ncbi:hypothetical protein LINPERPRIM_LOCUS33191 [Linum perenne]
MVPKWLRNHVIFTLPTDRSSADGFFPRSSSTYCCRSESAVGRRLCDSTSIPSTLKPVRNRKSADSEYGSGYGHKQESGYGEGVEYGRRTESEYEGGSSEYGRRKQGYGEEEGEEGYGRRQESTEYGSGGGYRRSEESYEKPSYGRCKDDNDEEEESSRSKYGHGGDDEYLDIDTD